MKNADKWLATKFVFDTKGRLRTNKDPRCIKVSSRLMANRVAQTYQRHLPEFASGRLIDLACGNVPFYGLYKDHVSESVCVDWANSVHKNEFLDLECDLTKPLPFADSSFNTAILSDVLEHIPEPLFVWKEVNRVLADDGVLIMNVPFFYPLHERPFDFNRYTEYMLRWQADKAGFEVALLVALGGSVEVIADILAKHLRYIKWIGNPLAAFVQSMAFWFGNTTLGNKILLKSSQGYPYGYFLVAKKRSGAS